MIRDLCAIYVLFKIITRCLMSACVNQWCSCLHTYFSPTVCMIYSLFCKTDWSQHLDIYIILKKKKYENTKLSCFNTLETETNARRRAWKPKHIFKTLSCYFCLPYNWLFISLSGVSVVHVDGVNLKEGDLVTLYTDTEADQH